MSLLRLSYVLAVRRTIFNWRLELVLFLGIFLTVALMSSGVIFSDLVAEAALRHSLGQAAPEEANFQVRAFISREAPATVQGRVSAYRNNMDFNDHHVGALFEPYLRERSRLLETPTFFFEGYPRLELDDEMRPRGRFEYMQGLWPERADLVQGRWPYSGPARSQPFLEGELEVAVDVLGAELLGLDAGDEMDVFPAAAFTDPLRFRAKIVGVFERRDPGDEYWYGTAGDFSFRNERWTIVPLFTTEDALFRQLVGRYPSLFLDITWFYYLNREVVRTGDVDTIQAMSQVVKRDVHANLNNGSISIKLGQVLDKYEDQLLPTRVPLFLIIFLVTVILIYYLGLMSALIVKSRGTELAMLKSRGATTPQLGLMALVESLLLAVPAVLLGPFVAQGIVRLLGNFFFGLGGVEELAGVPWPSLSLALTIIRSSGLLERTQRTNALASSGNGIPSLVANPGAVPGSRRAIKPVSDFPSAKSGRYQATRPKFSVSTLRTATLAGLKPLVKSEAEDRCASATAATSSTSLTSPANFSRGNDARPLVC